MNFYKKLAALIFASAWACQSMAAGSCSKRVELLLQAAARQAHREGLVQADVTARLDRLLELSPKELDSLLASQLQVPVTAVKTQSKLISLPIKTAGVTLGVVFAPVKFFGTIGMLMARGERYDASFRQAVLSNIPYISAYVVLVVGTGAIINHYVFVDAVSFDNRTQQIMSNKNPQSTLVITSFNYDDPLSLWFYRRIFDRYVFSKGDIVFRHVSTLDELKALSTEFSQKGKKFELIDWYGHGNKSELSLANGSKLSVNELDLFKLPAGGFGAPGADLRFFSCLVGEDDPKTSEQQPFLAQIAAQILDSGGHYYASRLPMTMNLSVVRKPVERVVHSSTPIFFGYAGLNNLSTIVEALVAGDFHSPSSAIVKKQVPTVPALAELVR